MKIVIASDIYYPMTNGVAAFAHNLANGLSRRGHDVLVICPSFTGRKHKRKDFKTGVTTFYLRSVRVPFYPDQIKEVAEKKEVLGKPLPRLVYKNGIWAAINPYPTIKKALDKFQPDVIHLQTAETIATAISTYARRYNIPMVATGHAYPDNVTSQLKLLKPIKKPMDAILKAYFNSFLKHSEYATMPTELAIDDMIPKNRRWFKVPVEPLSNGVDLTRFKPGKVPKKITKKYSIDPNRQRILYVGRVDPEKSIEIILRAFAKTAKAVPGVEFLIVGDGTAKADLKDLATNLEISDRVKFIGKVLSPDLEEVYKSGTLFATASETETQGIVLIEAAATGLPLVAVDAGAVRELCQDGRNGTLCRPKDVDALSAGMTRILKDAKLHKKYSTESQKIAKNHDLNHTLSRFEEIYETAIELKG